MTDGWFAGLDPDDEAAAAERIASGRAESPDDWPAQAVDAGFATDTEAYYDRLHAATTAATAPVWHPPAGAHPAAKPVRSGCSS